MKYPHVPIQLLYGNHEELFSMLRNGKVDLVLNDQRRAFSDEYVNLILCTNKECIEISSQSPLSALNSVTIEELKNIPCILVASKEQQEIEQTYYQTVIGLQGEFLYATNLEEAHLMAISRQGFVHIEGSGHAIPFGNLTCRIPLYRGTMPMKLLPILENR